ncbi:hypothetical protein GCM10027402_35530 [Arthrobacter monumenti]
MMTGEKGISNVDAMAYASNGIDAPSQYFKLSRIRSCQDGEDEIVIKAKAAYRDGAVMGSRHDDGTINERWFPHL